MGKWEIANILEMANDRAKRSEAVDLGAGVICMWGTFNLLVCKVMLGLFGAFV